MTRTRDANLVRLRRAELGLTLVTVADRMARPASLLNTVEGGFVPKPGTQLQIAAALQTTPDRLWPGEWEPAQ